MEMECSMLRELVKTVSRTVPIPLMAIIEATKECNLNCPYCRRGNPNSISKVYPNRNLTPEALVLILHKIPTLLRIDFMQEGEPLCNPFLPQLLELTSSRGIQVGITTNGTLITPEIVRFWKAHKVNRVAISLDSPDEEEYERMRPPAKFYRVIESCKLVKNGGLNLQLNTILFQENIKNTLTFVKLAYILGASTVNLARAHFYDTSTTDYHPPLDSEENLDILYSVFAFNSSLKKPMTFFKPLYLESYFRKCAWPFVAPVIGLDGDIFPCDYTYDTPLGRTEIIEGNEFKVPCNNYKMGNIYKDNFYKIWFDRDYSSLRTLLKDTEEPEGIFVPVEDIVTTYNKGLSNRFDFCKVCAWRHGLVC